jgi:hypothetical protein
MTKLKYRILLHKGPFDLGPPAPCESIWANRRQAENDRFCKQTALTEQQAENGWHYSVQKDEPRIISVSRPNAG